MGKYYLAKNLSLVTFTSLLLLGHLYASEPSAFEIQSGATKQEMKELQTSTQKTQFVIGDFQSRIQSLEQGVDGLKSLYEGFSITSRQDSLALKEQSSKISALEDTMNSYYKAQSVQDASINDLKTKIGENSQRIKDLDQKIDTLSEVLLKANNDILAQLQALSTQAKALQSNAISLQNQIDAPLKKEAEASTAPSTPSLGDEMLAKMSKADVLRQAKSFYRKKELDSATQLFERLIEKNYHVAEANFYLGEIAYTKKSYNEALSYFKSSVTLDDKASYMPILLWHTAWSYRYLKDNANYGKFLNTLVLMYPNSEQGKKAKDLKR
ncbi:hypothetical protein BKH40_00360 [Helicobacter sp. 11S02629-2]|nr:hypothetical protein BKH40_00360 [Helicobacter sp. 11S02629-2]